MGDDSKARVAALYEAHAEAVRRFIKLRVPRDHAEDVAAEVWLAVPKAMDSFRGEADARTWLFEIAKNKCADFHRRRRDRLLVSLVSSDALVDRSSARPSRVAARKQLVGKALDALDAEERELLELRFLEDLSPQEIIAKKKLTVSANVVSARISRALKRLATVLDEER